LVVFLNPNTRNSKTIYFLVCTWYVHSLPTSNIEIPKTQQISLIYIPTPYVTIYIYIQNYFVSDSQTSRKLSTSRLNCHILTSRNINDNVTHYTELEKNMNILLCIPNIMCRWRIVCWRVIYLYSLMIYQQSHVNFILQFIPIHYYQFNRQFSTVTVQCTTSVVYNL